MPPDACPRNPAKSGHWWIIDTPSGRYSSGYCKYCKITRDDFDNTFQDYVYGHMDGHVRKEPDLRLSADERSKRHAFYEGHKAEVIETYRRLENVREAAEELSAKWKVEVPATTIYGLLRIWKIERKPKRLRKSKKGRKGRARLALQKTREPKPPPEPEPPEPPAPVVEAPSPPREPEYGLVRAPGLVTSLEMKDGIIRMILEIPGGAHFRIGGAVQVIESP